MTSLRARILGVLALLLCVVGGAGFFASSALMDRSLAAYEQRSAEEQVLRVDLALHEEVASLQRAVVDYGIWDDSALHMQHFSRNFLWQTFTVEALHNLDVDYTAFLTLDGMLHSSVDARRGLVEPLLEVDPVVVEARRELMKIPAARRELGGDLKLWIADQPVLLVFSPVRIRQPGAPTVGWLVMGREWQSARLSRLMQLTGSRFNLLGPNSIVAPADGVPRYPRALGDVRGANALRLLVDLPQALNEQKSASKLLLLANALVLILLGALAVVLLLDRLILKRLGLFAQLAREQRSTDPVLAQPWPVQGQDELDELALSLNTMVAALGAARSGLEHDVRTDALTELGNRRLLYEQLDRLLAQRQRQPELTLAVLLIDLDDFKLINDSLGHEAGDFLLTAIARSLELLTRGSDVVVRLGGDEFALLYVAQSDELGVRHFAERVQESIAQTRQYQGSNLTVSCSIGVSFAHNLSDKDSLMRNADLAMYDAKRGGKGRCSFYDDSMLGNVQERMLLEQRLRECLRCDQLEVWFQPIVDARTGATPMLEALARWPLDGDFCPPAKFIPIAEESGLIIALGMAIARKVVAALPALLQLNPLQVVNINLSAKQLMSTTLVEEMCALVDGEGLPRSCVHFELTESAVAKDSELARQQLQSLALAGFHLHLDDFGTGYSSLHRLQSLPFSTLKLDRSFVIQLGHGDARIAKVIIALGAELGMAVIAEGIETELESERLLALGCHLMQGYWHGRPMPLQQVLAWLESREQSLIL
ncbi:putative bifunctional diguanylate cyclase/phosphodiesterase [Rhodoferax sp.]|uniref:putative bifunctional diguanylate cyclase/phosphodiesterase n=1 Tax=Rhodoferax sp. TaxID=50421 RepID=UPI00374DFB9C